MAGGGFSFHILDKGLNLELATYGKNLFVSIIITRSTGKDYIFSHSHNIIWNDDMKIYVCMYYWDFVFKLQRYLCLFICQITFMSTCVKKLDYSRTVYSIKSEFWFGVIGLLSEPHWPTYLTLPLGRSVSMVHTPYSQLLQHFISFLSQIWWFSLYKVHLLSNLKL